MEGLNKDYCSQDGERLTQIEPSRMCTLSLRGRGEKNLGTHQLKLLPERVDDPAAPV